MGAVAGTRGARRRSRLDGLRKQRHQQRNHQFRPLAAPPTSSAPATSAPTVAATVSTTTGPLGTFLTTGNGRTLDLFAKDTGTTSTCTGECAASCPRCSARVPLKKAARQAQPAKLGTTARSGDTTQVTNAGHPPYLFIGDTAPGETKKVKVSMRSGQWYVASPAGNQITQSPPASSTSAGGH